MQQGPKANLLGVDAAKLQRKRFSKISSGLLKVQGRFCSPAMEGLAKSVESSQNNSRIEEVSNSLNNSKELQDPKAVQVESQVATEPVSTSKRNPVIHRSTLEDYLMSGSHAGRMKLQNEIGANLGKPHTLVEFTKSLTMVNRPKGRKDSETVYYEEEVNGRVVRKKKKKEENPLHLSHGHHWPQEHEY